MVKVRREIADNLVDLTELDDFICVQHVLHLFRDRCRLDLLFPLLFYIILLCVRLLDSHLSTYSGIS